MSYDRSLINRVSHNDPHVVCVCNWPLNPRDWFELLCLGRNPRAFSATYLPFTCSLWPRLYICAHGTLPFSALYRLFHRKVGPDVTKLIASFLIGATPNPIVYRGRRTISFASP